MHRKPPPCDAIEEMLSHPVAKVSFAELAQLWQQTRVTFTYTRPPDLEDGHRLPAAIRGALGEQLALVSRERHGDDPQAPSLFPALYADHGQLGDRRHVPKPFVIWCHATAKNIYVEITLVGDAGYWRDDLIEAMARIMLQRQRGGEGGISLTTQSPTRRVWKLIDVFWRQSGTITCPKAPNTFVLSSITPVVMGSGDTLKGGYADLFLSLAHRIEGLARWQGLEISPGSEITRQMCREISAVAVSPPKAHRLPRKSRSFASMTKWENGISLNVRVVEYPQAFWPIFVLGTFAHFGYEVAQGYGRYQIDIPSR